MSRVMTFSRQFPGYHPKAGEPTYFVEGILKSIMPVTAAGTVNLNDIDKPVMDIINDFVLIIENKGKHHTIRAGNRWKAGDRFSPRVWQGKPYRSKQLTFAPDIQVKKVWSIEINFCQSSPIVKVDGRFINHWAKIACNDGLTEQNFFWWFAKPFTGQIICWNDKIEY